MREKLINKYLTHDIRFHNNEIDDRDTPDYWISTYLDKLSEYTGEFHYREFSDCNQYALINEFLKVKNKTKVIVEIGVARLATSLYEHTSTTILVNNKREDTLYLGIDIEDKSFLEKEKPNIHTLMAESQDYEVVKKKFNDLGITHIDFLFIDGWHSVNQVIDELWYADYVPSGGVIGYHDTNYHPGPSRIIDALNPELFESRKHCINKVDWGIGFATKK